MLVALVLFPLPETSPVDPTALITAAAPAYRQIPGLRRKYFIGNSRSAGGIYEWEDQASADQFYNQDWKDRMRERYGAAPQIQYFDAPCLVDNVSGNITPA